MIIEFTYNPYTKEKVFIVDGEKQTLDNCWNDDEELSVWVNSFFDSVYSKFHRDSVEFIFSGIERDFEYLQEALSKYIENNTERNFSLKAGMISKPNESFSVMKEIFAEIQSENNPFDELKSEDVNSQYNTVISNEFEMAVIATVSSGKSTLINSILGRSLLPSGNEPLTAKVVRIHDKEGEENFSAETKDFEGKVIGNFPTLSLSDMRKINDDGKVSVVEIFGDIRGIQSDNLHLVLTDTPGTNNGKVGNTHKAQTYGLIFRNEIVKPVILYILNSEQLRIKDDKELLQDMAKAISEGGKADSDRFIFILNRADAFDPQNNEDLQSVLNRSKVYLEECGIKNPRIFPCSAKFALVIRKKMFGYPLTDDEDDDYDKAIKTVTKNRTAKMFSNWSPLSDSLNLKMNQVLELAKQENDVDKQALIYSGIPAIEIAINDYLLKYAIPVKIKDGVASFNKIINDLKIEENEKEKLLKNEAKRNERILELEKISATLKKGNKAKELEKEIEKFTVKDKIEDILDEYGAKNTIILEPKSDENYDHMKKDMASRKTDELMNSLNNARAKFSSDLVNVFEKVFMEQIRSYVESYNNYVKELIRDNTPYKDMDPAAILGKLGSLSVDTSMHEYTKTEREQTGTKKVEQEGFLGGVKRVFGTIFQQDWGYDYKPVFENFEYVNFNEFITKHISKKVSDFEKNAREKALQTAFEEENRVKKFFKKQILKLNDEIEEKLSEQKQTLKSKENYEYEIAKNNKNIDWLKKIDKKINCLIKL